MQFLGPLAGLLGIEVESITERVKNALIVNALIAISNAIAMVFLLVAGFLALATRVGSIYSALIFTGIFLVLALGTYIVAHMNDGRRRRQAAEKRRSSETGAFVTTAAITALPVLLRSPVVRTVGIPAAALAAFLFMRGGRNKP